MQNRKRDTDVQNRLLDSVGEGEGGMFWENSMYIIYSETDHQPRHYIQFPKLFFKLSGFSILIASDKYKTLVSLVQSFIVSYFFLAHILGTLLFPWTLLRHISYQVSNNSNIRCAGGLNYLKAEFVYIWIDWWILLQ